MLSAFLIWTILALVLFQHFCNFAYSTRLLLLGDSLDSNLVEYWCDRHKSYGFSVNFWTDDKCLYLLKWGKEPNGLMCKSENLDKESYYDNVTVAAGRVFGASNGGPYYFGWELNHDGNIVNTTDRIQYQLELYRRRFSTGPDIIYLTTIEWDHAYMALDEKSIQLLSVRNSAEWNETISKYEDDMNSRLNEISDFISLHSWRAKMGLRTGVFHAKNLENGTCVDISKSELFHGMNEVLRRISHKRDLVLYDYDKDVWSTMGFDYTKCNYIFTPEPMIRHPLQDIASRSMEKMIGRRYSRYMHYPRGFHLSGALSLPAMLQSPEEIRHVNSSEAKTVREQAVYFVRETNGTKSHKHDKSIRLGYHSGGVEAVYILSRDDASGHLRKHAGVNLSLMYALGFGLGDVFHASTAQLQRIPDGAPCPHSLIDALGRAHEHIDRIVLELNATSSSLPSGLTRYMLLENRFLRPILFDIHNCSIDWLTGRRDSSIHVIDSWMIYLLSSLPTGLEVANIYYEGAYFHIARDKKFYAVIGGKRRSIAGLQTFYSRGWEFSLAVTVHDIQDFLILPDGGLLESR